jgi:hypothetical protein
MSEPLGRRAAVFLGSVLHYWVALMSGLLGLAMQVLSFYVDGRGKAMFALFGNIAVWAAAFAVWDREYKRVRKDPILSLTFDPQRCVIARDGEVFIRIGILNTGGSPARGVTVLLRQFQPATLTDRQILGAPFSNPVEIPASEIPLKWVTLLRTWNLPPGPIVEGSCNVHLELQDGLNLLSDCVELEVGLNEVCSPLCLRIQTPPTGAPVATVIRGLSGEVCSR